MTGDRLWVVAYRAFFAALTIAAIVTQFLETSDKPGATAANFFSFFTIQSNVIAAFALAYGVVRFRTMPRSLAYDRLRGAATVYMAITGAIFSLLLADLPSGADSTIPWVNLVLHYLMPLVMLLDWILVAPNNRLGASDFIWWLGYPIAYVLYTLFRGAIAGWYPYPFLDAGLHGVFAVLRGCLAIAVGVLIMSWAIVAAGNVFRIRRDHPEKWAEYQAL